MKLIRNITWTRTRLAVATAVVVPLAVGGGLVAAHADTPDEQTGTTHGTAQLTEEGEKMVEESGLPTSGSVSVGPDGSITSEGSATAK